ncbi:ABC transporter permease [Cellulomonas fimi]|uniref:ABC transporter permease n=1 Tax=Cellulomonas fimi TaxID=1708 RepID=A0A7Y0LYP0_CELFI|nr:ABC transporter permease [Cellulomonas fimi]
MSPTGSPAGPAVDPTADDVRLTFGRVVASEWIKFRSLRSTVWTLGITFVLMVGSSLLMAAGTVGTDGGIGLPGASIITFGYYFGQLAMAVLAVLVISGEYGTGMIRSTFAAVPTRLPALAAKAIVLAVTAFVVSMVSILVSWLVTYRMLEPLGLAADLTDPETIRVVLGAGLYITAIALFAFALGALLRHTAAALATVFGLLLVVETVFMALPQAFFRNVSPFLPGTAGQRVMLPEEVLEMTDPGAIGPVLGPWEGYAVLVAWVVVLLATAAVLLRRRDA